MRFDVNKIRQDFPALEHKVCGKPFIYLDNAATAQMPAGFGRSLGTGSLAWKCTPGNPYGQRELHGCI